MESVYFWVRCKSGLMRCLNQGEGIKAKLGTLWYPLCTHDGAGLTVWKNEEEVREVKTGAARSLNSQLCCWMINRNVMLKRKLIHTGSHRTSALKETYINIQHQKTFKKCARLFSSYQEAVLLLDSWLFDSQLLHSTCQGVLGQSTEPQVAHGVLSVHECDRKVWVAAWIWEYTEWLITLDVYLSYKRNQCKKPKTILIQYMRSRNH